MNTHNIFNLQGQPFIALHNLLKVEGWCESGAVAKQIIAQGLVTVDGHIELRKRCKVIAGQVVCFKTASIQVVP